MAELATIARPYAKALFALAEKNGRIESWSEALRDLAWAVQQDKVILLIESSELAVESKAEQLLHLLLDHAAIRDVEFKNFVHVLAQEKRLAVLPEIYAQYEESRLAENHIRKAIVYSAYPMGEGQFAKVLADCQQRFGVRLDATLQVLPELIGGVRVEVGDQVLDMSVQGKLKKLYATMTS